MSPAQVDLGDSIDFPPLLLLFKSKLRFNELLGSFVMCLGNDMFSVTCRDVFWKARFFLLHSLVRIVSLLELFAFRSVETRDLCSRSIDGCSVVWWGK